MSLFSLAIPITLKREGGFVNDAADPGGATKYGVSMRWLNSKGLLEDSELGYVPGETPLEVIQKMTPQEASDLYEKYWWNAYHYGDIIAQAVASKVFDTSVNVGPTRAHKFLQSVLLLPQDGLLGPNTLSAANAANSLALLQGLQAVQAQFYRALVAKKPELDKYLAGWLNRAYDRP
jgi:lysozyme family protein